MGNRLHVGSIAIDCGLEGDPTVHTRRWNHPTDAPRTAIEESDTLDPTTADSDSRDGSIADTPRAGSMPRAGGIMFRVQFGYPVLYDFF